MSCLGISSLFIFCLMLRTRDTLWTTPMTSAKNVPEKKIQTCDGNSPKRNVKCLVTKKNFYHLNQRTLTNEIPWIDIWTKLIHFDKVMVILWDMDPFLDCFFNFWICMQCHLVIICYYFEFAYLPLEGFLLRYNRPFPIQTYSITYL